MAAADNEALHTVGVRIRRSCLVGIWCKRAALSPDQFLGTPNLQDHILAGGDERSWRDRYDSSEPRSRHDAGGGATTVTISPAIVQADVPPAEGRVCEMLVGPLFPSTRARPG